MKGSSFHTHITPCPGPFFHLVPHAIRDACRLPCCKIFEIHVLHKALVFFSFLFLPLFGISIVVRGCRGGLAGVCQSKYSRKMLGIAGEIPLFSTVHAQLAIDFYCKSVRALCFSAVVVFSRKPFYVEKNCTCVCVWVCVYL